jgi:hypothetical protein
MASARFVPGYPVTGCKLDFQLNDFIPLLITSVTLRDRQQIAQTATVIVGRWSSHNRYFTRGVGGHDRSFGRGIRV